MIKDKKIYVVKVDYSGLTNVHTDPMDIFICKDYPTATEKLNEQFYSIGNEHGDTGTISKDRFSIELENVDDCILGIIEEMNVI